MAARELHSRDLLNFMNQSSTLLAVLILLEVVFILPGISQLIWQIPTKHVYTVEQAELNEQL